MAVARSQLREPHKAGIKAGVDGKKPLRGADLNKDGKVEGTKTPNKPFSAVDDLDRDGSRNPISDQKPSTVMAALSKSPAMPGGPVDQAKVDELYAPDAAGGLTDPLVAPQLSEVARHGPKTLAGRLDASLPRGCFDYPWQRERILERGATFENQVKVMAATATTANSPIHRLRSQLGGLFPSTTPIELHCVASHFEPETLQAHVRDKHNKVHVFVRDSSGAWVERKDLAKNAVAGKPLSKEPGLSRESGKPKSQGTGSGTNTLAVATLQPDSSCQVAIPDLSKFDHMPRVKPLGVGDTVQVPMKTGDAEAMVHGQTYVSAKEVKFGQICATDGKGQWTIELTARDGSIQKDKRGESVTVEMTDAQLRANNNPSIVRNGVVVIDATFDSNHPAQQKMLTDWHQSATYQKLAQHRPGPNAPPEQRAHWERQAIKAADNWLHAKLIYPDNVEELKLKRNSLLETNARITQLEEELASAQQSNKSTETICQELNGLRIESTDTHKQVEAGERHHVLTACCPAPNIGEYYVNGAGNCLHQAVAMQVLMQDIGVDSRMTIGAGNAATGAYRGQHMWLEVTLSNGDQLLADPTWTGSTDAPDELRGQYENEVLRREQPDTTDGYFRGSVVKNAAPPSLDQRLRGRLYG